MSVLILNASPKGKNSASRFFSGLFQLFLPGVQKKAVSLSSRQDFQQILELFPGADVGCFFTSLCGCPSIPCSGISHSGGKILQESFLSVPVGCTF